MANERNLTKQKFVNWLIDYPTVEARRMAGVPESVLAWASENGIARETCQRWKSDEGVQEAVHKGFREKFASLDDVAEIMEVLKIQAKKGNTTSARIVLEAAGILGKRTAAPSEKPPSPESFAGMTDAQLKAMAAEVSED